MYSLLEELKQLIGTEKWSTDVRKVSPKSRDKNELMNSTIFKQGQVFFLIEIRRIGTNSSYVFTKLNYSLSIISRSWILHFEGS